MLSMLHFTACKKDDDHDHSSSTDTDKPVITMSSPSDSMMYNNGDTMYIKGTVTDNSLHELLVTVLDANDSILYSQAPNYFQASLFLRLMLDFQLCLEA